MENYNELCPKFLLNPHINPVNNLPIEDEEFDYYRYICKDLGYEFPPEKTLELMYNNEYYGRKVCKDFIEDDTINPVTGGKLFRGTKDYNSLIKLCDYYNFDASRLGTKRSIKSGSQRKNVFGQLPLPKAKLLPIPNIELLPSDKRSMEGNKSLLPSDKRSVEGNKSLLPVPIRSRDISTKSKASSLSPMPNRISRKSDEEDNILTNLKMIVRELHKDAKVKKIVIDTLSTILEKNADRRGNKLIISGGKNRYGIKQFILDLLINNEIDLVMRILKFFGLEYIDIAGFLFDFPTYANNETLIVNYFINADPNTDWTQLDDVLQDVYENWVIEEKLKLLILLISSSIAVGGDFITEILTEIFNNWREGIQEEIDELEDEDIEEKDRLIDLVEIIDTLSIR